MPQGQMREPALVMATVRTRYQSTWREWLLGGASAPFAFSLSAPSTESIVRDGDAVGAWMQTWRAWARDHPTAQLRGTARRTVVGPQEIYTHLELATLDDLVALDPALAEHWVRATGRWTRLTALPAGVPVDRIRPHLSQIADQDDADFEILLGAASWFSQNPRSGLTVRQVPIPGMHTKWLARNRRLVLACLDVDGRQPVESGLAGDELEQDDLDPLGLKALPVHINVILADPADRARIGGLRHLNAPLPEIRKLPIRPETVVIVENRESAFLVPDRPRTVVVHSLGNNLDVLAQIVWVACAPSCFYWGDLDRAGLTLLSRARARLPNLRSVLMDLRTLDEHAALTVPDKTKADSPEPTLSEAEAAALAALSTGSDIHLRLEQERLSARLVLERLGHAFDEDGGRAGER